MVLDLRFLPLIRIVGPQLCQHPYFSLMVGHSDTDLLSEFLHVDYILQDFGGEGASYLSKEDFEKLLDGDDEAYLEVRLNSWCVVKLE